MKKLAIVLVILSILLAIVMTAVWNKPYPGTFGQGTSTQPTAPAAAEQLFGTTTMSGTLVCLPHKNAAPDTATTLECAYGLKADSGSYYALDFSGTSASVFDLPFEGKYMVTGVLTPVEALSSNLGRIYDIRGLLKVLSYKEVVTDADAAAAGSKLTLELNKPITVRGTTLTITGVIQDSRCPSDVQCIQAGRVVASLAAAGPSGTSTVEITIGQTVTVGNIAITLSGVEPYPISTKKITDAGYRFSLNVSKN